MATRSDFYKSLGLMRDKNSTLGNPLVNTSDDTTSVGNEASSYSSDRNYYQRFFDTSKSSITKASEGLLNFVDGIFDGALYVIGLFGNDDFKQDIKNTMDYDWQQYPLNVVNQMNVGQAILSGDMFTGEYWKNWADTFDFKNNNSRKNINQLYDESLMNEFGVLGETANAAVEGVGYVLPSVALGIASGGASAGVQALAHGVSIGGTMASAFGSGVNEALHDGANYNEAGLSGVVTSAIEGGTELLSAGIGKGIGKITGKLTNYGSHVGGASFGQALGKLTFKEIGQASLEEGTEEFVSEILSPLSKSVYKGEEAFKAWTDVGSKENIELLKNALVSGVAGSVGGAFGNVIQSSKIKSELGNKGIDLANDFIEMAQLHSEAIKQAKKGSKTQIQAYEERIGTLAKDFVSKMEAFEKSEPTKYKNLLKIIKEPSLVEVFTKDTYDKIAKLNGNVVIGEEIDFKDKGNIKAYYDHESKTTFINPKFKNDFYQLVAHEKISHGILDTNVASRTKLINSIESNKKLNELFHKHDKELSKLYKNEELDSERLARFLENYVTNQKELDLLLSKGDKNIVLSMLNKIRRKLSKGKVLDLVEKAITEINDKNEDDRVYKPKISFKKDTEENRAVGVDVHADITKAAAQGYQDKYIFLNGAEDAFNFVHKQVKSLFGACRIKFTLDKADLIRQAFVDYNNKAKGIEDLHKTIDKAVDYLMIARLSFKDNYTFTNEDGVEVTRVKRSVKPLFEVLEDSKINLGSFKKEMRKFYLKAIENKARPTVLARVCESYSRKLRFYISKIEHYRKVATEVISLKKVWDRNKKFIEENKARVNKVGDLYTPKLEFFKGVFRGNFGYNKSSNNVSVNTINHTIKALEKFNKENVEKLGGVWTEGASMQTTDEEILQAINFIKDLKITSQKQVNIDVLEAFRFILNGINLEMRELTTLEGLERRERTKKADLELLRLDLEPKKKLGVVEQEFDFTSSMNKVFDKHFGTDSEIYKITYGNPLKAYKKKALQEARMKNELINLFKANNLWSNTFKEPISELGKKVKFMGKEIRRSVLMDIYAQSLTEKGYETLLDGGYAFKGEKREPNQHIILTDESLLKLEQILTKNEKNFVKQLVEELYNGSWKDYKIESDRKIRNFTDVLENELYYPTNKSDTKITDIEQEAFSKLDLSNQSMNKARKENTKHMALLGMGILDRATSYIDGLTLYGELTQDIKVLSSLLNQWTIDNKGKSVPRSKIFKENIPNWDNYIHYVLNQATGNKKGAIGNTIVGNVVGATLFGNVSVVLKQTGSIPSIMLEVSNKSFLKALAKGTKNLAKYKETKEFLEANSGIASLRWSDFDVIKAKTLNKEANKIGKIFGIPMEKMDEAVIVTFVWQAAQEEAKLKSGYAIGTKENQKLAIEIFDNIVLNTQSNFVPINTSMARSGNAGQWRKVLSYFSSDLQNTISFINKALFNQKYAKERIEADKKMIAKYEAEVKEFSGSENEEIRIKLNEAKERLSYYQELLKKDTQSGDKKELGKLATKLLVSLFCKALIIAGIDELVKRLLGRKGWTEDTIDEFANNLLLEATINNLPYVSHIVNAIEYGTGVGGFDYTLINSAIDIVKDINTMVDKGKFDMGIFLSLATTLGQITGIPFKNLYNLIIGVWKNVDESGYEVDAFMKGYSDNFINRAFREKLENGATREAKAHLDILMKSYKTSTSDEAVNDELIRLYKEDIKVLPKNKLEYVINENGEKVVLTEEEQKLFNEEYSKSTEEVKKLIESAEYKSLSNEEKGRLIKQIFNAYHELAKNKILKKQGSKLSSIIPYISVSKIIIARNKINQLKGKELAIKEINALRGYTKQEKLLVMWLCGYSLTKQNKATLGNYLIRQGADKRAIKELLK